MTLQAHARPARNRPEQLRTLARNPHQFEGSHRIRTRRQPGTGNNQRCRKRPQRMFPALTPKRQGIVAARANRLRRAQRIPILDGNINRRLIRRSNQRLSQNASRSVFDRNRLAIIRP